MNWVHMYLPIMGCVEPHPACDTLIWPCVWMLSLYVPIECLGSIAFKLTFFTIQLSIHHPYWWPATQTRFHHRMQTSSNWLQWLTPCSETWTHNFLALWMGFLCRRWVSSNRLHWSWRGTSHWLWASLTRNVRHLWSYLLVLTLCMRGGTNLLMNREIPQFPMWRATHWSCSHMDFFQPHDITIHNALLKDYNSEIILVDPALLEDYKLPCWIKFKWTPATWHAAQTSSPSGIQLAWRIVW